MVMRALCASFLLLVLLAAASAADLKVKVIDPQSVAGAQVSLFAKGTDAPLKIATTSAEGIAAFGELPSGSYQIQVLAPGFALQATDFDVPAHSHVVTN